jgi:hypothetical protein
MVKKIMLGMLAAAALALNAPAAHADEPVYDCGFDSSQEDRVTGQNYEGVVYGYVAHTGPVSIRCYITVNGTDVGADVTASGTNAAANASRVTFAASDTDSVRICWRVTTSHGWTAGCVESTSTEIPPRALKDLIDSVGNTVSPLICRTLQTIRGTYGPIMIDRYGNVFINGVQWYWCPWQSPLDPAVRRIWEGGQ